MEKNWYVVHTYSGYENKVKKTIETRVESLDLGERVYEVVVPTQEEIEEINHYLAEMERPSLDQLRELGMFEFMLGPKPEQQARCSEMVAWLNQFITDDLMRAYLAAAEFGQV